MNDKLNELSELKHCPFCGSEAVIKESWLKDTRFYENSGFAIGCGNNNGCPASNNEQDEQGGFACEFDTKEEAINNWNNRPIEDALNARIAELEALIDQLIAAGESLTRVAEWRYANLTELLAWDTLVEKIHKEREE